jgi:acetate kinase
MKILVFHCGIFGLEYTLYDMDGEEELAHGIIEGIGTATAIQTYHPAGREAREMVREVADHYGAVQWMMEVLTDENEGVIKSLNEIDAFGHRVFHGGEKYRKPVLINEDVLNDVIDFADFAPVHNPYNAEGIKAARRLCRTTPHVAVFDTSFYHTLPSKAYLYGLPYQYYTQYRIRKYGFHGPCHLYGARQVALASGTPLKEMKIVSLYIGRGASMTAIDHGKAVETSMGFSPLEGLVMKNRCGDLDPAVIIYLAAKENLSLIGVSSLLNKSSGLFGLSGLTNLREVAEEVKIGNERARRGLDAFVYRVHKYFGAYYVVMKGVDVLIFTARDDDAVPEIRSMVCDGLDFLGVKLDAEKNQWAGDTVEEISSPDSSIKVYFVPRNDELEIARETRDCLSGT